MKKKHGDYAGVVDIARNGIDRVIMLEDECARLRAEVERLRQLVNGGRGPLPAGAVAWLDMSPGEASLTFDKKSDSNRANKRRVMELFHRVSAGYYPLYLEPQADRAERLAEALRYLLELPIAEEELRYLDKGIGTATRNAAWLRARAALHPTATQAKEKQGRFDPQRPDASQRSSGLTDRHS